jgi:hypothetical protein
MDDDAVDPSGPEDEEDVDVHDALHPDSQRELQSVVQSNVGGLVEQEVAQLELQLDVQSVLAEALHCESHCCSSFAAHACSQLGGAHCVEQLCCVTSVQLAFASMSMFPQAEMFAEAVRGQATRAAKAMAVDAPMAQGRRWVFMSYAAAIVGPRA